MAISVSYLDDNDGTGGVLTVAGSSVSSTNYVYASQFAGGNVRREMFQVGSRTGDGVVPYVVTQSGPFLVAVVSEGADVKWSVPQVFRAGDGVEAPHMQVCVALREMILDMALPGLSANPASHKIAKVGAKIQDVLDTDGKGVFYIPTQESLSYADNTFDAVEYPVNVVMTRSAAQELSKGLGDVLKARFAIHVLFGSIPIPDIPWVHTVDYRPGVINDATQWLQKFDVSVVTLVALTEISGGII